MLVRQFFRKLAESETVQNHGVGLFGLGVCAIAYMAPKDHDSQKAAIEAHRDKKMRGIRSAG